MAKPLVLHYTPPPTSPANELERTAMIVEQIWTANAYRNFNYMIACAETGEALAVDPLDHAKCLAAAKAKGWTITQILNTHEHSDHTGGNAKVVAATGAKVLAHANARDRIPGMERGLHAGDVIKIGKTVELEALDTPGHTMSHICLRAHGDHPALFCGDTLFNAGAGNCHNGGHPNELYGTFATQLAKLPDAAHPLVTTLALEKEINTFFRLTSPSVIKRLREAFPDLPDNPDPKTVFVKLRELRNKW